ncbi:MAG: C-mannosyltransferase dpy-19 family protein [Verrucomicrobia bacterium]|nr:C-mannosyltransferase dpy-19 family protein [Verrucomicrobiota bacterium]MBU4285808.1 C-mannosyltransferase dpy-19 family protein [Verrucomicrobiota bacterium]
MITRYIKILLAVLGLVALFAAGLAIRRVVLSAQFEQYGRPLPFNLESALEFRYVRMLFETGHIPRLDKAVQVPEGVVVRETYTLGAEYVYAAAARLFPRTLPLDERVRWIAAAWFCLGIPLMSLWLWAWTRSAWAAGIAGAYYAVSLAAVMRSTGQELQHENFALPLLIGHWALGALANRVKGRAAFFIAALLSALMLACAMSAWDLIQYYVILWGIWSYVRFVAGKYFRDTKACLAWWLILLALAGAGVLNPYLRAHAFAGSFAMLLAYGVALGLGVERLFPLFRRSARLLIPLLPLIAGALWIQQYGETYSHFLELLWAKLRFLNHKPADPALLTFDQRILWTAPLNSATFLLTATLFPVTLWLSVLAGTIALFHTRAHPDPEINQLLSYTVISLLAFVFFMRFHVFLILGFAALLGWLGYWVSVKRSFTRWLILVLLLVGVGVEAAHVMNSPARWGSVPVYLNEKRELCRWLRSNTAGERVLANFGLSSFLLTYANCPIVLHPKFESPGIRERVRAYGEALFKSNEEGFRAWMEPFGVPYYVYALGEFADIQPESQMRYCVNALNPPPSAAARLFEKRPEQGRYFRFLWGNAKYRVFRVITRADELSAGRLAAEAMQALRQGRRPDAENKATQALMYDPQNTNAMQVLLRLR